MALRSEWRTIRVLALAFLTAATVVACAGEASPPPKERQSALGTSPDSYRVAFETSRGRIVVQVNRRWAPLGADRFYQLVDAHFFDDARFFRVLPNFVAQFGLSGEPKANLPWDAKRIADDPVTQSNVRGTLTFATEGANTRTHQLFINIADNSRLDPMGFAPIGAVIEGMAVADSLYNGYEEKPSQDLIQSLGNDYLNRMFPKLDYIKSAKLLP